jgi:hypothetical protein
MWCQSISDSVDSLFDVQKPGKEYAGCIQCCESEEQMDRTEHELDLPTNRLEEESI